MFWGRSSGNVLARVLAPLLFRFSRENRFEPDLTVEEGDDLSDFGLQARVLALPGHSRGSIGILTVDGSLFCGDLLENTGDEPTVGSIVDDQAARDASLGKLTGLEIHTVYPGHGRPFPMEALANRGRRSG
jgi:glyoxylase-like metal-dependent hydrolase (beta-lactamase superfamily II)